MIIALPGARAAGAAQYTIELTGSNGTTQSKTLAGGTSVQFDDLAPDTYSISVKGMDDAGNKVLSGTAKATVTAGETATVTVELNSSLGNLTVEFTVPAESSAASYTVEITDVNSVTQSKTVSDGTSALFEGLIPGLYSISVMGKNTADDTGTIVLSGTEKATVVEGETATVTVKLQNLLGSLTVDFSGASATTGTTLTVTLTDSDGVSSERTSSGEEVYFENLIPRTYNIVVEGMDTNNKVVLGGASSATVVAGKTASTTVELVEGVSDFAGLQAAVAAGGTVNILKNIDVSSGLTVSKTVEILPAYQDVTLKNTGSENLFTVGTNGNLTIGGGEYIITLDGNQVAQSIISMSGGTATLADNGIITNAAASGVYISSATFTMSGGSISGNTVTGFGGAVCMMSGTFSMTGGSIDNNSSGNRGGGVSVNGGSFNLSGGSIASNSAVNDGDGVYMSAGVFNMSGSAVIASDNDVYLDSGTSVNKITVSGELTGGDTVATITPYTYPDATTQVQVLSLGNFTSAASKFAVTPKPDDGTQWTIDTSGNLQQVTQ